MGFDVYRKKTVGWEYEASTSSLSRALLRAKELSLANVCVVTAEEDKSGQDIVLAVFVDKLRLSIGDYLPDERDSKAAQVEESESE